MSSPNGLSASDLVKITGSHQLFLGVPTYSWNTSQFAQAADFARNHGVDTLLVKVADGTELWYGGIDGFQAISDLIHSYGVGCIPYTYGYGNKFGALDGEIDILTQYMQRFGVVMADLEVEYNGQASWATHLCSRMQPIPGTFIVSTWADPSLQNWLGVIRALAPCVTVWAPQQYNTYLASFWQEFAANGATWLQPTVNLTQDFGANDPVVITQAAHSQKHTAISVWYYDTAIANPGLLDAVYAAFPKENTMNTYGPNSSDFNSYFTANSDGSWTCEKFNTVLLGGNLGLFQTLSVDGQTLPIIGLPLEGEQYHTLSDGYQWSSQQFERGTINFDPSHRIDSQPGLGASYLAHVNPPQTVTVEKIPDAVAANIKTLATPVAQLIAAVQ